MHAQFDQLFTEPENSVFKVVFYPDRIYHAPYLNATRSERYRYNVREVRSQVDITVLKGEVYLDGQLLTSFVRVEYRPPLRPMVQCLPGRVLGNARPADDEHARLPHPRPDGLSRSDHAHPRF